jgi:tetratricopeptide (TPR) repeat protein
MSRNSALSTAHRSIGSLSEEAWARLERVLKRFEVAWGCGERPALDDYLTRADPAEQPALLVELVHADLEYRLKGGEDVRVEVYLGRYPELAQDREAVPGLIAAEYELRRRRDEGVTPDEYYRRFPAYREELRSRLSTAPPGPGTRPAGPPPDPAATWRDPAQQPTEPPHGLAGAAGGSATPPARAGRYLLEGEIAAGGMGSVWRARDPQLGRPLAVKVLLERHRGLPELERRFHEEAQITGQLQHPGIPPVHELGTLEDGRPFFALKLIQGRTLADLLRERPRGADATPLIEDLPRWLVVFEQVCQALAYAHSRGVIHRDLKPHNVMVGAFGEVQVMDWGLAKVLGRESAAEAGAIATVRTAAPELASQAGAVLGTPAYMAPEQARGEVEQLDERCDVFGLGAILCVLLTGRPPYSGGSGAEVRTRAGRGDLAEALARLEASGADAELVELARDCLAPNREGRPRHAGIVAERVAAYQAGVRERLRRAELERARAQVKAAEERKRRRLAVGLAAALLALVALGAGAGLWWQHQRDQEQVRRELRAQAARRDVDEALGQAAAFRRQARWGDALAVLKQAAQRLNADDPADLRAHLEEARGDVKLAARLDAIRLRQAVLVDGKMVPSAAAADYARAFRAHGLNVLGGKPAKWADRIKASAIRAELVAALDDWARVEPNAVQVLRLLAVARRADPNQLNNPLRDPLVLGDPARLLRRLRAANEAAMPPALVLAVASLLEKQKKDPVGFLRRAQERHPGDFWINFALGSALFTRRRPAAAIGYYRVALVLRPGSSIVYNNLGTALAANKDQKAAVAAFRKASACDPNNPLPYHNLGLAFLRQGKLAAAARAFRQAIRRDQRYAKAHFNLGVVLASQGLHAEAIQSLRRAIKYHPGDAAAYANLGGALLSAGQVGQGIAACRKALLLDPRSATAFCNLGAALKDKGDLRGAVRACRRAIEIDPTYADAYINLGNALTSKKNLGGAVRAYHKALKFKPTSAKAYYNLGVTLQAQGKADEAIKAYRQAICYAPKDSNAYNNLGTALQRKGDTKGAVQAFRQAIKLDPRHGSAYCNLGFVLFDKGRGDVPGAIRAFRKAARFDPTNATIHFNLGAALGVRGDWEGAIKAYRRASACDPKMVQPHFCLGLAFLQKGQFADARKEIRHARRLLQADDPLRPLVVQYLQQCQRLLVLDRKLAAVLKGEVRPRDAAERLELALFCQQTKHCYAAAARFYAEAFAAQPKLTGDLTRQHRYNAACCAALAAAGRGQDASNLGNGERSRLRKQALAWLRADYDLWAGRLAGGKPADREAAQKVLRHWQKDPDLAGLRDAAALARLPAGEQKECRKLWADVAALLAKAQAKARGN